MAFSAQKLDILVRLCVARGIKPRSIPVLKLDRATEASCPLSQQQEGIWFFTQARANDCSYNQQASFEIRGDLDVAALKQTFQEIVRRHDILRSVFVPRDGKGSQIVCGDTEVPFDVLSTPQEGAGLPADLVRKAEAELKCPFDLSRQPPFRVCLCHLSADHHMLFVTSHHIVCDGWSLGILMHEFCSIYNAIRSGVRHELPDLELQYSDYARWSALVTKYEDLQSELNEWAARLTMNAAAANCFPASTAVSDPTSDRLGYQSFGFPDELSSAIRELACLRNVSVFVVLLATFKLCLHAYSRLDEITVGSDYANREQPALENVVGFFVNQIVLSTRISELKTIRDLLRAVERSHAEVLRHKHLPFAKLVESSRVQRDQSHSPFFKVKFVLQNTPAQSPRIVDASISARPVRSGGPKFDVLLNMKESDEGFEGDLEYRASLYTPTHIGDFISVFQWTAKRFTELLDEPIEYYLREADHLRQQLGENHQINRKARNAALLMDRKTRKETVIRSEQYA